MSTADNMKLWKQVEAVPPEFTKKFDTGRFRGTSANPMYLIKRATELFGPCGKGWGFEEIRSSTFNGCKHDDSGNQEIFWLSKVSLWVGDPENRVEHYGVAPFVGYKRGGGYWYSDGEAPKKAMTNALSKCLSLLGFAANIWMGYYDSEHYVENVLPEWVETQKRRESHEHAAQILLTRLNKVIGCETDEDRNAVIRWASNKYQTLAEVLATEGAPEEIQRAIAESGKTWNVILEEARNEQNEQKAERLAGK